jgi:predicted nucleotidyltransferase
MKQQNKVKNKKYLSIGNFSYQMEDKFTINEQIILEIIYKYPSQSHSARELARITTLSHPTVLEALAKFKKLGIVKKQVQKNKSGIGKNIFWEADLASERYRAYKKISNMQKVCLSELIETIASQTSPNTIVLFGSYSRGEDAEYSDIDLFVQSTEKEINLKHFEKKLGRKINIMFESDIKNVKKELLNNIINGIVLYGYLEVFK